jgi:pimeloyl-ACP methyl ester carboxylesterase
MFAGDMVTVSAEPRVNLFVATSAGPADRTLLVIHGGPDWDHSYLRQPLDQLAGQHRLVLPDLRGCGRSSRGLPVSGYTPDAAVGDLLALIDALGPERIDVLGFSYGGLLAQRLALAARHRVRRLIIASSSVQPVPDGAFDGWTERDRRVAPGQAVWSDQARSGAELTRAAAIAGAAANVWRREALPEYLRRLARIRFSGDWLAAWRAGALPSARPDDPVRRLAALDIPVLLLHGRQDMTFPAGLADAAADAIPSAYTMVLDDAGHMAHIDQPGPWLDAVRGFLA